MQPYTGEASRWNYHIGPLQDGGGQRGRPFTKALQQTVVRTHSRSLELIPHLGSQRRC